MIYSDSRIVTPGAANAEYQYRGNSIFDPYQTGIGQQPRGYDEYSALYGKYYVVKSSISVIVKSFAGTQDPFMLAIYPYGGGDSDMENLTLSSDPQNWYAQDRIKMIMPGGNDLGTDANQLRYMATTKQVMGKGHDRNDLVTYTSANPLQGWTWSMNIQRIHDLTTPAAQQVTLLTTIVYDVIFSDPRNFSES